MMGGVFCSFASADFDLAHDIALTIADDSYPIWFDRFRIEVGTKLTPEIIRAIAEANCLVVVVSAATHQSAWVLLEVETARALGRSVLQVLVDASGPLAGLRDEAPANLAKEGFEDAISRLLKAIGSIAPKDFEGTGVTPFIPVFLETPNRTDSFRLQQRLSRLDGIVDRLTVSRDSVALSRSGDELPKLIRRLQGGRMPRPDDPLVRQTLILVQKCEDRLRGGIADIVSNLHRLRMFRGRAVGHWSVYAANAVAEYVRIARSLQMSRLLMLSDLSYAKRVERGEPTEYLNPFQIFHDPASVVGRASREFTVFHKGSRLAMDLSRQLWQARDPHVRFWAAAGGELARDIERWGNVDAADYPFELSEQIIPQMLLKSFLEPRHAVFWDFDECAIGPP